VKPLHLAALAAAAVLATQAALAPPARTPTEAEAEAAARATPVTIVIPALNEEKAIRATLRCVAALDPPPADVIVAVGPSTDATAQLAAAAGAHVVRGGRGRVRCRKAAGFAATHLVALTRAAAWLRRSRCR
jgi:cellulose synthase/poly-beta-1,6-N-acetylglucosamine synthase-like glycosyltransferase